MYRAGRLNGSADALSRDPHEEAPSEGVAEREVQVASVHSEAVRGQDASQQVPGEITDLLARPQQLVRNEDFAAEQKKDPDVKEIIDFMEREDLPMDDRRARRLALQRSVFVMEKGILFYLDPRQGHHK